ncbi:MAG: 1,4-beta-xylanase [Rhodobacteraceae bacterium]|nr:1,4-beta-xylanase [Paracoccaceae bacterium]
MERWSAERANNWWADQRWICGFNFLPSSAVNFLEMWHKDSFDRKTIRRELGWAADLGFNALRVNLHYLIWKHDRDGLMERLNWLMDVADGLGLKVVPCLFDDCGFEGSEPEYGPQSDPVPNVHNSRAVASPGRAALLDQDQWPQFEGYLRDVIRTFRADRRILFWDLYNEPGNRMVFEATGSRSYEPDFSEASLALMKACFEWCRTEAPVQPATVGAWATPLPGSQDAPYQTQIDQTALELSDIVTFHAYWDKDHVLGFIDHLAQFDRPILCTEWMARPVGSRIEDQLEVYQDSNVGCFQWGLVKGRTQTNLPWPSELVAAHGGTADRSVWFHDLLDETGRAYDKAETETLRRALRSE